MLLLFPVIAAAAVTAQASALNDSASVVSNQGFASFIVQRDSTNSSTGCVLDRSAAPGNQSLCGNNTLFQTWRPKARFIAPNGWMNDPMGLFQRKDGSFHAGYQHHPNHIQWGNISQGAAHSEDLVYWQDFGSWESPLTLWPSEIYDIRGVFDGSILKNGWDGYPTIIYTSTFTGSLGATSEPPEQQGAETQSMAYTTDEGASWIKLNFGPPNNPIIYNWPAHNLTGFRDPYVFQSPLFSALLANVSSASNTTQKATGDNFLTVSGGFRPDNDSGESPGGRLFLYRQTSDSDVRGWTYLGQLQATGFNASWSEWSGNFGQNYETASVQRLNPSGLATDAGTDRDAVTVIGFGTEQGRNGTHENHWPLWTAVSLSATSSGGVNATIDYAGVVDWGRVYAYVGFPVEGGRQVGVGWIYEDDETLALASQFGYQGALTLFRDLFVQITPNVDPSSPGLNETGSWGVRKETDGSTSVITIGQTVVPEILSAYKSASKVTYPSSVTLQGGNSSSTYAYVPFEDQPSGQHYAIAASLDFVGDGGALPLAGLRVLASDQEWTDIVYDPNGETLNIYRTNSSLIATFGDDAELGKLRLWNVSDGKSGYARQTLDLTIFVDGSVVEVYANNVTIITTRAYPWLDKSIGAGWLVSGGATNTSVKTSNAELWDGLLNAWPSRPTDTSKPLKWDGPLPSSPGWGDIWAGI